MKQPYQEAKAKRYCGFACTVNESSSGMRMDGKCVLREAREGKEKKFPEKAEVQNKDWLGKETLFHTEEFLFLFFFSLLK